MSSRLLDVVLLSLLDLGLLLLVCQPRRAANGRSTVHDRLPADLICVLGLCARRNTALLFAKVRYWSAGCQQICARLDSLRRYRMADVTTRSGKLMTMTFRGSAAALFMCCLSSPSSAWHQQTKGAPLLNVVADGGRGGNGLCDQSSVIRSFGQSLLPSADGRGLSEWKGNKRFRSDPSWLAGCYAVWLHHDFAGVRAFDNRLSL